MVKKDIENTQKGPLIFWGVMTLVFISVEVIMYAVSDDYGMDIYGFMFIGLFLLIMSFVLLMMFRKRFKYLEKAINENNIIARWTYTKKEWQEFLDFEDAFQSEMKSATFKLLSIITIIVIGICIPFMEGARLAIFFVGCALIVMYFFLAYILPAILKGLRKARTGQIVIFEKGVLYNRRFHSWDFPLSKLTSIKYLKTPIKHLELVYEYWTRVGPQVYVFNIPVLEKHENEVNEVLKKLEKANPTKKKSRQKKSKK